MTEAFARATSFPSLMWATAQAAQGKRGQPEVARFLMDAERECLALQQALRRPADDQRAWQPGPCRRFVLHDPKRRVISVVPFRDRVVHHALCRELLPDLERYAIHDSYACRTGKGQHAALFRLQRFARHPAATWAFKGDIAGYFAAIPHDRLLHLIRSRVRDESLCQWLERIVRAYPATPGHGLPIGALTSQHFEEDAAARLSSQYAHLQTFNTRRLRCEHLARRSQAGLGQDHRRLESGEPGRLLGQRRAEGARRQPRQERAGEPQPEPGLSSFELSAAARPSGLVRGEEIWPEASSLRTAAPVPRC